jgi:hypothetical protein
MSPKAQRRQQQQQQSVQASSSSSSCVDTSASLSSSVATLSTALSPSTASDPPSAAERFVAALAQPRTDLTKLERDESWVLLRVAHVDDEAFAILAVRNGSGPHETSAAHGVPVFV